MPTGEPHAEVLTWTDPGSLTDDLRMVEALLARVKRLSWPCWIATMRRCCRVASLYVADRAVAEEVVQETWGFPGPGPLSAPVFAEDLDLSYFDQPGADPRQARGRGQVPFSALAGADAGRGRAGGKSVPLPPR